MRKTDFLLTLIAALVTGVTGAFAITLIVDFLTVTKTITGD